NRRRFLAVAGAAGASFLVRGADAAALPGEPGSKLAGVARSPFSTDEAPNTFEEITTYNNFYEFGTGKSDPSENAGTLRPRPWSVEISGHAAKTGTFDLEDFLAPHRLQERIYRMRCVEAWSMVIPWVGIPLADVIRRFEPTSRAKYVYFESLADPAQMPGVRAPILEWP